MARKKATAKAGDGEAILAENLDAFFGGPPDLSDDDHGPDGEIRPEVQARVDEEQRQLMATLKAKRDEEEKAERANHAGKLDRNEKRKAEQAEGIKALTVIVADLTARIAALEAKNG